MVKFRVTETSNGNFQDAEGSLPFDIVGLGPDGATVRVKIWNTSAGAAVVVPPSNLLPPIIAGTPDVGQTLSSEGDAWDGAATFEYEWIVDGGVSATTATLLVTSGMRGKTITLRKRAASVSGSDPSAWVSAANSLYIPATGGDGVLVTDEYSFREATADVDARKTYVEIYDAPLGGYEWVIYRGIDPAGVITTVAVPTFDGTKWVWTSTGTAAVGTGPAGRTTVYVRVGLRETANPGNAYFVTPAGENFLASSTPGAPAVTFETGAGQGEIDITITNGANDAGRALTRYEYQLDTGSWTTLPGDLAIGKRTINSGNPTTSYVVRVRAVNANGNGAATADTTVSSGAVTVAPAAPADAAWTVTDKPSAGGNTVTLAYTGALPANGGATITDLGYKLNGGSFVSIGLSLPVTIDVTVPATTLATFAVLAVNSVGQGATSTKTVTPTTTAALTATAQFGALTPALAGGWKPTTALGDEIDVTGIVSQAGMTRTWSVASGALVANGTPDVDNTKTLTISTAAGNIVVTIATTATAWSVRTPAELGTALAYSTSSALTIFMRPVTFDIQAGTATVSLSGTPRVVGYFYQRNYSAAPSFRKLTKHPSQVKRWTATKTSYINGTQKLWLDEVDFWNDTDTNVVFDCTTTGNTSNIKITNFSCKSPDPDPVALQDPAEWDAGPSFPLSGGFSFVRVTSVHLENGLFRNVYKVGDFNTAGAFRLIDVTVENFYYDAFRLFPSGDKAPKLVKNVKVTGNFAINNELGGPTSQEPHADSFQPQGGTGNYSNFVHTGIEIYRGTYRGTVQSVHMGNKFHERGVWWNVIGNSKGIWVGINTEGARDCIIGNSVFQDGEGSAPALIRHGGPSGHASYRASGENLIFNTAAVGAGGSGLQVNQNGETLDFVTPTLSNCVDAANVAALVPYFNDPYLAPTSWASLRTKYTSKPAQTVGPLDEAGAWRSEDFPPLPGGDPVTGVSSLVLAHAGADLTITPGASMLYNTLPTVWDYKYRNADGVNNWTKVEGRTGTSATLVAPNKTGIQVKCRWKNAAGIPGPWSETQTVIV